MTNHPLPTLGALLAEAAGAGTVSLAGAPLPLEVVAALYTAVHADRHAYGLYGIDRVDDLAVHVDGPVDPAQVQVVTGSLRYLVTTDAEPVLERLCLVSECEDPRLGQRQSTAYCHTHIVQGQNAPHRLEVLKEEARQLRGEGEGLARVVEGLRTRLVSPAAGVHITADQLNS